MDASVWFSFWIVTPSLASIAWCSPSDQRRPGMVRPVNSSTMTICPSRTMYSTFRWTQRVRTESGVEVVHQDDVRRIVETLAFGQDAGFDQNRLDRLVAVFGQMDLLRLLVNRVVAGTVLLGLALEPGNDLIDAQVQLGALVGRPRDDERGTSLVDEDRVHLVDDRECELALHLVGVAERHVVTQIVETKLVVRRVDDICGVGVALVPRIHSRDDDAGPHAQKFVDRSHPLRVALRQIVVDGNDVHAAAGERVQVRGEGGDERLALAGTHLGDPALVERDATEKLDIEMTHLESAPAGLAHHRERLGQHRFECFSLADPAAKGVGPCSQIRVGECRKLRLERVDALDGPAHPTKLPVVAGTDDLVEEGLDHHVPDRTRNPFAKSTISI